MKAVGPSALLFTDYGRPDNSLEALPGGDRTNACRVVPEPQECSLAVRSSAFSVTRSRGPAAWLYARRARRIKRMPSLWLALLAALLLGAAGNARAASCAPAASAGTAPADWATYCWLDFSSYDDALARAGGQAFTFNLPDGSTLSFVATVTAASTSVLKGSGGTVVDRRCGG